MSDLLDLNNCLFLLTLLSIFFMCGSLSFVLTRVKLMYLASDLYDFKRVEGVQIDKYFGYMFIAYQFAHMFCFVIVRAVE